MFTDYKHLYCIYLQNVYRTVRAVPERRFSRRLTQRRSYASNENHIFSNALSIYLRRTVALY